MAIKYDLFHQGLTFDLHYSNEYKADAYRTWVRRVYSVSRILGMSYTELWDLPEQEFLLLEELAEEIKRKQEEQLAEISQRGDNQ